MTSEPKWIIVFKEKHGNRYFDASDDHTLNKVFLQMLEERLAIGYYYDPDPDYPVEWTDAMNVPEETLETLPEGIKSQVLRLRSAYKQKERETRADKRWWELLNELLALPKEEAEVAMHHWKVRLSSSGEVREKSRLMATFLMECRKDGEYEGYEVIELEELGAAKG